MAINNTYTEEFDWFNMSPHHIETNTASNERSIKIINDYIKTDFKYPMEEGAAAVDSGPGQACEAYKNWKNINLGLGPLCGFENPVIVGQVRQDLSAKKEPDGDPSDGLDPDSHGTATSWFQGVKSGSFQSDGLMVAPYRGHMNDQADVRLHQGSKKTYGWNHNAENRGGSWEQSDSKVVQFHVPGGLKANTWMPLFSWQPYQIDSCTWGNGFHWLSDHDDINYWEYYAQQAVSGPKFPFRSPHHLIKGLRTAPADQVVWNEYDVDPSKVLQSADGNVSYTWQPSTSNSHNSSYHSSRAPVVWWYAHDGNGNAMIVSILQNWHTAHAEAGYGYNAIWGLPDSPNVDSSGCYMHKPPTLLKNIASEPGGIAQFQEWANAQNTSWVYKDSTTGLTSAWSANTYGIVQDSTYWNYSGQVRMSTAKHFPEIVHGLTPFGSNADLSSPQNFYLHRYGTQYQVASGRPLTSYKFGNLVKTNTRNAWFNGQGRGGNSDRGSWGKSPQYAPNVAPSLSLNIIAAAEVERGTSSAPLDPGPVRINFVTSGGQFDPIPVREDKAELFFEFPGKGVSYGAIDRTHSIPEDPNSAWTNVEALVDPTNTNEAVCKASGSDNAVFVPLVGMTEGNSPDNDDAISTVSLTLGGTRKMVLGPQVLQATIVDENGNTIPTVPVKTIPGEGSDTLNDDLTVVWDNIDVRYNVMKSAKLKIWVHTPG